MEHLKFCLAILLSASGLSAALAVDTKVAQQSSNTQPDSGQVTIEPSPEQITKWVANLGSDSFRLRRESFVQLWRTGKPALQAIQVAMRSSDKQQAETAGTLEILIRLNVTEDDPVEAADLLGDLSSSPESALVKLCEKGYWNVAIQLLDMNADLLDTLRSSEQAYFRMNLLVDEALEQDDVTLAWPVIQKILPYQQALWIAKKQSLEPPKIDDADPSVQAWSYFIAGKHAEVQTTNATFELRADMAVRGFQWNAFSDPNIMLGLVGQRKTAGQQAARAVMLEFAEKLADSDAIWDWLIPKVEDSAAKTPTVPTEDEKSADVPLYRKYVKTDRRVLDWLKTLQVDPGNLDRTLNGLILSGRAQIVQDFLLETAPESSWSFCLIRGEQEAAFSSVGLMADLSNFDSWLEKRRDDLHAESQKLLMTYPFLFQNTMRLASTLQNLGKFAEADETYKVLVNVCQVARQRGSEYWVMLAAEMTRAEGRHRFLGILAANYSKMDVSVHDRVLSQLYPECELSADALFQTAPDLKDGEGLEGKWQALEQLYAYNREYFGPLYAKILSSWLQRARSRMSQSDSFSDAQLTELAKLASGVGQSDLALEFASEIGEDIESWAYAGRVFRERGSLKNAIECFSKIRRTESGHQESILEEADLLLMLGRVTEAQALQKSRWLRPLMIYGTRSWFTVAQRLSDEGQYGLAKEYVEPTFQLFGCDMPDGIALKQRNFIEITYKYCQIVDELKDSQATVESKDIELSADLYRAILAYGSSSLKPSRFPASLCISIGAKERTRRATLAARNNDMVAFERHASVAENLQPQGVDLVEDTYLELVATGNQKVGDDLFARYEKRLLEHLERWPKDATTHNNLAWMYARCNLKLEEALEHSQIAVELSPHSAILLDTLAEVQFRLKYYSAAIDSMHRCIQLDPRDPHLRRQLERFLKAQLDSRKK